MVNFVSNKSTQETRTRLSSLILHYKEMPRKEQTLKIGFKKNFDMKYQRIVFIVNKSETNSRWLTALLHAGQSLFFIPSSLF